MIKSLCQQPPQSATIKLLNVFSNISNCRNVLLQIVKSILPASDYIIVSATTTECYDCTTTSKINPSQPFLSLWPFKETDAVTQKPFIAKSRKPVDQMPRSNLGNKRMINQMFIISRNVHQGVLGNGYGCENKTFFAKPGLYFFIGFVFCCRTNKLTNKLTYMFIHKLL